MKMKKSDCLKFSNRKMKKRIRLSKKKNLRDNAKNSLSISKL